MRNGRLRAREAVVALIANSRSESMCGMSGTGGSIAHGKIGTRRTDDRFLCLTGTISF